MTPPVPCLVQKITVSPFRRLLNFVVPAVFLAFAVTMFAGEPPQQASEVIIEFDATWRYHDGDEDLGTGWRGLDYDDADWNSGPALLGYDTGDRRDQWPEPGLRTELREHLITYYFRKEFEFTGSPEGRDLLIEQIIDDAAVYYLNGREIARSARLPEGEVGFETRATAYSNPWYEHEDLLVENAPLREGRNVLAVSVHNNTPGSSDICFGARVSVKEPSEEPIALYLTWQKDPTSTMTIQWHTDGDTGPAEVQHGPMGSETLNATPADSHPMVFSDRLVHTAEITGLDPDTEYRFRLTNTVEGVASPFYKFRTMPRTADRPIRMVVGGDVMHREEWMAQVNLEAMRFEPDFIAWGGDLAYSDGRHDLVDREYVFFRVMRDTLIAEDGRVVPVLMGIGNHEVLGGYYWSHNRGHDAYEDTDAFREEIAPYYYNLFAFPGHPGYGYLDFGDYMSLVFLDSDHSGPVEGTQTEWLEGVLAEREGVPHLFPIYHVPAYPSVRNINEGVSRRIREHWLPLFEEYGVRVAFEHHDHAYKRTVSIRQEAEHPDGIVFIGDGAWGVGERVVHDARETWYLERSESIRHLILVTIQDDFLDMKMINREGQLIDHYIPRRR